MRSVNEREGAMGESLNTLEPPGPGDLCHHLTAPFCATWNPSNSLLSIHFP